MAEQYCTYEYKQKLALVIFSLWIIILVLKAIFFVLKNLPVMKIAKRMGIKHRWLSLVPIADSYIFGKVAFKGNVMPFSFLGLNIISTLISIFAQYFFLSSIFSGGNLDLSLCNFTLNINIFRLLYTILKYDGAYQIYKKLSDKAVMMTVFTVLTFGLLEPIFLFAIRNNEFKNEAEKN